MGSLFFDRGLPIWAKIEKYLTTHDKDRAVFFFAEDARARYTKSTIVSRPVIRWFDIHWDHIMSFCGDSEIADDKARLRFRGDVYANIREDRGSNASSSTPRTSSSRFSDYVRYDRNVALCIRADGLIEGFMLITDGYRGDMELDVICSGKRGKGVGRLMVQTLKKYAVSAGKKSITLTAIRSSIGFYKKLGFKMVNPEGDDGYDDMDMIWISKPPSYSVQPPGSGAGGRSGTQ
jgi:GNAT superfamily N-acetyltransferase